MNAMRRTNARKTTDGLDLTCMVDQTHEPYGVTDLQDVILEGAPSE